MAEAHHSSSEVPVAHHRQVHLDEISEGGTRLEEPEPLPLQLTQSVIDTGSRAQISTATRNL